MMPLTDIQPLASSSKISAMVAVSIPRPPNSSAIVIPNRPSSFICSTSSVG